jgi:hypothetical protein
MKKYITLLLTFIAILPVAVIAQLDGYSVTRNTSVTYTSISSTGSSVSSWRNGTSKDDNLSNDISIGFNFTYAGATRTSLRISTNAFVTFNSTTTQIGNTGFYGFSNGSFSSTTTVSGGGSILMVAPMWDDLVVPAAGTLAGNVKYKLDGTSPNQVFTIEWIGMERFSQSGPDLNFQVKLFETSNEIQFYYGTMTPSTGTYTYSLGLTGSSLSSLTTQTMLAQQTANSATFSATASNALSTVPAGSTQLIFTPVVCTTSPVGGTVSGPSTATALTAAGPFDVTGNIGNVQWQVATSPSGPYTDISGATSASQNLTFTSSGTLYVRNRGNSPSCVDSASTNYVTVTVAAADGDEQSNAFAGGIINVGSYSFSGTTVGYTNNIGNAAPDVYYAITTGSCVDALTIGLCTSSYDTYLRLLDGSGSPLTFDDDACTTPNANGALISNYTVSPATNYFIVVEGFSSNSGTYTLTVDGIDNVVLAADAGTDFNVCTNSGTLNAVAAPTGYTGTWSVTSGTGNFQNSNLNTSIVNSMSTVNIYQWTLTDNNASCPTVSDIVLVNKVPKPSGLSTGTITATTADVSWTSAVDPDSFLVRYQKNCTGTFYYAWVGGTLRTATLTGLDPCTNYCFRVRAQCSGGALPQYSTTSGSFTTGSGATCIAASGVTLTNVTGCDYTVSWNNCTTADSFRIRYREGVNPWLYSAFTTGNSSNLTLGAGSWTYRVQTWCSGFLVASTANMMTTIGSCRTAGVSEELVSDLVLFPNPTNERSVLNFTSTEEGNYILNISDISGRVLRTMNGNAVAGENTAILSVADMSKGIYFVSLELAGETKQIKLIVQ